MVRKSDWRQKDREGAQKSIHEANLNSEIIVGTNGYWTLETGDDLRSANVMASSVKSLGKLSTGWENIAIMSWDGLLRPVTKLNGSGNDLPQYAPVSSKPTGQNVPSGDEEPQLSENTSTPKSAQPPFIHGGTQAKEAYYLNLINSYLEPLISSDFNHYGNQSGHDIDVVARYDDLSDAQDFSLSRQLEQNNGYTDPTDDARFMALRGPLVISGWGFDTDGKPVPNRSDSVDNAARGIFSQSGHTDEFMDDWLKKSQTWPTGPVDLRWDRRRGCWVSPPAYKLVRAQMTSSTEAYQTEGSPLYDSDGNAIPFGDEIRLEVREESGLDSGDDVILYYSHDDNKYWNLGGGGGEGVAIPLDLVKVGGSQGDSQSKPSWTYDVFDARKRKDSSQSAIASAVDPTSDPHQWVRHLGQMTVADFGWGWYNPDNELEVTWINEILIAAECDTGCNTGCEPSGEGEEEGRSAFTGIASSVRTVNTTPVVLTDQDHIVILDAVSTPIQVDLPPAAAHVGGQYFLKKIDATTNSVTIQANGLDLIDGSSTESLTTQYQSSTIVSDGSGWFKIS